MELIRTATQEDVPALLGLAQSSNLINLPPDEKILAQQVQQSLDSFSDPDRSGPDSYYMFVMEDDSGEVIGTSAILGQHGTRDEPHVSFEVSEEEKYAPSLDRHFTHKLLKLSFAYDGPTEIGGIILAKKARGTGRKLGKLLSFVRFLYLAHQPSRFRPRVIAEMMPPYVRGGWSPLWNALGQRFTGLSYVEADQLSRKNKAFIRNLFPHEPIYAVLLPEEAQNVIGAVAPETEPAVRLLRSIGFEYMKRVDPFDGGPHYIAEKGDISLVKNAWRTHLSAGTPPADAGPVLVGVSDANGGFRTILTTGQPGADPLPLDPEAIARLGIQAGAEATATHW